MAKAKKVAVKKAAKKAPAKKAVAKKAPAKKAAKKAAAPAKTKVPANLKTLTASQLVSVFAGQHELSRAESKRTLDSVFGIITDHVMKGVKVKLGDLGTLLLAKRAARMGRNPQTGAPVKIAASKKLRFRQSRTAKEALAKMK